jgi:hypothetical protein
MQLSYPWLLLFIILASVSPVLSLSLPYSDGSPTLQRRTTPYFPSEPASCPICEANYTNINTCAQACPVLANFTMVRRKKLGALALPEGEWSEVDRAELGFLR